MPSAGTQGIFSLLFLEDKRGVRQLLEHTNVSSVCSLPVLLLWLQRWSPNQATFGGPSFNQVPFFLHFTAFATSFLPQNTLTAIEATFMSGISVSFQFLPLLPSSVLAISNVAQQNSFLVWVVFLWLGSRHSSFFTCTVPLAQGLYPHWLLPGCCHCTNRLQSLSPYLFYVSARYFWCLTAAARTNCAFVCCASSSACASAL